MSEVSIVPYEPKYRDVVRRCVFETGYGGETVMPFFTNIDLFADMNVTYYTDYEPEHAYIGMVDGEPAGYLLGCSDTQKYEQTVSDVLFPKLLKDLARGQYKLDAVTLRYLGRGMLQLLRGEYARPPLEQFPAHLHIDLFKPFRRFGLGSMLINRWLDDLRAMNSQGVQIGTSSFHVQALPFYEKLGFRRYAVRRVTTSIFKDVTDMNFYSVWYVMGLRDNKD